MKLFETSLLEIPITMIRFCSSLVDGYYVKSSKHFDAYEHFWTGFIIVIIGALMPLKFGLSFITLGFFIHVVVKEYFWDVLKKKQKLNKVDFIMRIAGFLFAAPIAGLKYGL